MICVCFDGGFGCLAVMVVVVFTVCCLVYMLFGWLECYLVCLVFVVECCLVCYVYWFTLPFMLGGCCRAGCLWFMLF